MVDDGANVCDNPFSVSARSSFEQEPTAELRTSAAAAGPAVASDVDVDNATSQIAKMTFARFGTTPTNWQYVHELPPVCACVAT